MAGVRFGMFDWIDRRDAPLGRIYEERLQLIEAGEAAGFFCYHLAEHHATPLELRPAQQPYPPLWYATTVPDSVRWAAAQGLNLAQLGPAEGARANVDLYRKEWEAHRHDPDRLNAHVAEPTLSINRQIVVAD